MCPQVTLYQVMSMFAEATRRAAQARFKQKSVDSEGQEIEVITDKRSQYYKPHLSLSFSMMLEKMRNRMLNLLKALIFY